MDIPKLKKTDINIRYNLDTLMKGIKDFGELDKYNSVLTLSSSSPRGKECLTKSIILPLQLQNKTIFNLFPIFSNSKKLFTLSIHGKPSFT